MSPFSRLFTFSSPTSSASSTTTSSSPRPLPSSSAGERTRKLRRDQMMTDLIGRRGVRLLHPSCSSLSSACHSSSLPNSDPLQQSIASLLLTSSSIDNDDIDGRRMAKNLHCRQSQATKPHLSFSPFSPSHPSHHSRMRNTHNRSRILVISLTLVVILSCLLPTTTAAITEKCLRCICHASSGCDSNLRCHNTGDGGYFCGPYQISWAYWSDAGKMGSRGGERDFESCLNNKVCAEATIVSYMNKYSSDCNHDGVIDCMDFAAIHKAGPTSCNADWFMNSPYWRKFQETDCYRRPNPDRSSRDFFLEEIVTGRPIPGPQRPPPPAAHAPRSPLVPRGGGRVRDNGLIRPQRPPRPSRPTFTENVPSHTGDIFTTPSTTRFNNQPVTPSQPPAFRDEEGEGDIPSTREFDPPRRNPTTAGLPTSPDGIGPPRHTNFDQPPHVTVPPFNGSAGSSSENSFFHALPDHDGNFNFNAFRFPSPVEEFHGGFFPPPSPSLTTEFSSRVPGNNFNTGNNLNNRRPGNGERRRIEETIPPPPPRFENFNGNINNNNRPRQPNFNTNGPPRGPPPTVRPFDAPPRGPPPIVPRGNSNPVFTNGPPRIHTRGPPPNQPTFNTSPRGPPPPPQTSPLPPVVSSQPPNVIFPPGNQGRNRRPGPQGPPPQPQPPVNNNGPENRELQPFVPAPPGNRVPANNISPPPPTSTTIISPRPSSTGLVPASCLPCLCAASSGCDLNKKCVGDFCGPYLISWSYWSDGGRPGNDFVSCALDVACAEEAIQGYMKKWTRDCNGDGIVDCDDFAAIHKLGPHQCRSEDIVNTPYWREYEKCGARGGLGGLGSSSTAVTDLRRPERGFNDIPFTDNNPGLPPSPPLFFNNQNPPTTPRPAVDLPLITPRRRLFSPLTHAHDGENNSVETVTAKPVVVDITSGCMECICEASSGCNFDAHCSPGGPDTPPSCGPFQLDHNYWRVAGRPGYRGDNRIDFERCASEKECAEETVNRFIRRMSFDCNEDGVVDCLDYASIHRAGPKGCNTQWFLESKYWSDFEQCYGFSAR